MAKIIDITEKLSFDENPKLKVKNITLEVQSDAATVLKIMGILGDGENASARSVIEMYQLIFSESDRKKIDKLKLQFKDFQSIVFTAINLITGEEEELGE